MRVQLRRGTAAQWAAANPVLSVAEPGFATDTGTLKIGDGSTAYAGLPSIGAGGAGADPGFFPASGYGAVSLTAPVETFDGDSTYTDGTAFTARMWVPAGKIIGAVGVGIQTAASGGAAANENGIAVYEDDGTRVATKSDANLYNSGTGLIFTAIAAPVAAQGSGRFVRVLAVIGGWTGVRLFYANRQAASYVTMLNTARSGTNRRCVFDSGVTAFPASIIPASYGTTSAFLPLFAIAEA